MITIEFVTIITDFERDFPDWTWLVRNNNDPGESGGYFANVRPRGAGSLARGEAFPAYGPAPEAALTKSLFAMHRARNGTGLKSVQ